METVPYSSLDPELKKLIEERYEEWVKAQPIEMPSPDTALWKSLRLAFVSGFMNAASDIMSSEN